jgi:metal-sulfur cluster biosynthetic enzyme
MEINTVLPTEEAVLEALRSVEDPEVGMSIVELGLVYRIDVAPERVHIEVTMTTPACPMGNLIANNAPRAVGAVLPEGVDVASSSSGRRRGLRT